MSNKIPSSFRAKFLESASQCDRVYDSITNHETNPKAHSKFKQMVSPTYQLQDFNHKHVNRGLSPSLKEAMKEIPLKTFEANNSLFPPVF